MKHLIPALLLLPSMVLSAPATTCPHYSKLLAYSLWSADESEISIQVGLAKSQDPSFSNSISFCSQKKLLLSEHPDADFIALLPLADSSPYLASIWLTGNGTYKLKLYHYGTSGITTALEAYSSTMPEFIQNNSTTPIIVLSQQDQADHSKLVAYIYLWSDGHYQLWRQTTWNSRHTDLSTH
jgi:hypothetical protein